MGNDNIDKRQRLLLIVIAVLSLFFAVVGATFAYFTIVVQGNEEASSIYIKSVKLGQVVFEDGQGINLIDVYPGEFVTKTFTIRTEGADPDIKIGYSVYLVQTTNEFATYNIPEFMHEIIDSESIKTSTNPQSQLGTLSLSTVPSPASTAPILTGTLYGNDSHTYTYRIGLLEANADQNRAQGRTFIGILQVDTDGGNKYTSGGALWSSTE